ncbi:hypothetical protein AAC387_Pa02g1568 [Persea americana]
MKSMVEGSAAQMLSSKGCIEEEPYCYLKRFSMYVSLNKHLWQSAIPCWHAQFYFWCHLNVLILLEKIRCGEWSCIIDVGLGAREVWDDAIVSNRMLIFGTIRGIQFLGFRPSEVAAAVAISVTEEIKTVDFNKAVSSCPSLKISSKDSITFQNILDDIDDDEGEESDQTVLG